MLLHCAKLPDIQLPSGSGVCAPSHILKMSYCHFCPHCSTINAFFSPYHSVSFGDSCRCLAEHHARLSSSIHTEVQNSTSDWFVPEKGVDSHSGCILGSCKQHMPAPLCDRTAFRIPKQPPHAWMQKCLVFRGWTLIISNSSRLPRKQKKQIFFLKGSRSEHNGVMSVCAQISCQMHLSIRIVTLWRG